LAAARLCGFVEKRAGTGDVIDAALVLLATDGDEIVTSDAADLKPLAALTGQHVELVHV
jgi:hypothetical protein